VGLDGMPEGVSDAARRPEPPLPAPQGWPFGEHFPRTSGTGRMAAGAVFWTDFLYDDHGATGTRIKMPGTYLYPEGPAAGNGADIFRAAVGLTETHTWWRIDWNSLQDPSVPIGLFTFDTGRDRGGDGHWPAGAGVRSPGVDSALLISGAGAWRIDLATGAGTAAGHTVDRAARSFLARVPRALAEPAGSWTVRLVAGPANPTGDRFADVPAERGAQSGQPNVYNVAFRRHEQEPVRHNFWMDQAQAAALADGDVSRFGLVVAWDEVAAADRQLLEQICEKRDSVVVTPLGRGPACWYLDEGELDFWEVWARAGEQLGTDPNRTVTPASRWEARRPTGWA
jgi:hypothetical protein